MIKQKSMKLALTTVAIATLAALTVALHPQIVVTHDALIVNTTITSSIIDHSGIAVSVVPSGLSCGIDSTVWCEVAHTDSDATPAGLLPLTDAVAVHPIGSHGHHSHHATTHHTSHHASHHVSVHHSTHHSHK